VSGPAKLRVQFLVGDTVVHEFVRTTAQPTAFGVRKMTWAAMSWLQAWGGQLADDQLLADVQKAREAQRRLAEEQNDGIPVVPAPPHAR
jgi:hypothetical protein